MTIQYTHNFKSILFRSFAMGLQPLIKVLLEISKGLQVFTCLPYHLSLPHSKVGMTFSYLEIFFGILLNISILFPQLPLVNPSPFFNPKV